MGYAKLFEHNFKMAAADSELSDGLLCNRNLCNPVDVIGMVSGAIKFGVRESLLRLQVEKKVHLMLCIFFWNKTSQHCLEILK